MDHKTLSFNGFSLHLNTFLKIHLLCQGLPAGCAPPLSPGSQAPAPAATSRLPLVHSLGPGGSSFNSAPVWLPFGLRVHGNATFSQGLTWLSIQRVSLALCSYSRPQRLLLSLRHFSPRAVAPACAHSHYRTRLEGGSCAGGDFVLFMALQLRCSGNGYRVKTGTKHRIREGNRNNMIRSHCPRGFP